MGVIFINPYRFAAFDPLSLSPLLWLDAADTSTITSSGSPAKVSQWNDKSGNAYHVSQATSVQQPTTGSSTQNALNILDWSGGQRLLSAQLTKSQPITMFAVAKSNLSTFGNRQIVGDDNVTPSLYHDVFTVRIYATNVINSGQAIDTNWHYLTAVFNGASSSLRQDGTQIGSGNVGTSAYANKRFIIGGNLNAVTGTAFWNGSIAEILIYNATLSSTDRDAAESYLKAKWGL